MLRNVARTLESDRGAALVYTALTVPLLIIFGAVSLGITSLWTSHHDLQRSVDFGALAAAANTPTAAADIPLEGMVRIFDLDIPLDATNWQERPCAVALRQLDDGRSIVSTAFSDGEAPTCDAEWQYESQLLATLAYCAENAGSDLAGCRDRLDDELRAGLPLVNDLDASAMSAAEAVRDLLPNQADKLVGRALASQLGSACANEIGTSILGVTTYSCTHRLHELLSKIDHRTGALLGQVDVLISPLVARLQESAQRRLLDPLAKRGVGFDVNASPRMGFRPDDIAPAVLTPRVRVDLDDLDLRPPLSPITFDYGGTATARRVIKSAVVLPTLGVPGMGDDAWNALPQEAKNVLRERFGDTAAAQLKQAAENGWVLDPNMLNRNARYVSEQALQFIDQSETTLSSSISGALCSTLADHSISCPVGDDLVDRDHLFGPFVEDVADATQPAPQGTEPTLEHVLGYYADNGIEALVIAPLRAWLPVETFGEELWETLTNPQSALSDPLLSTTPPNLGPLFSPLMFIPAMDVVPAAIFRDGDTFRIERVAATTGLYKARLVK